jgi:hypothetical protein
MRVIHKIVLDIVHEQTIDMMYCDKILKVDKQNDNLCVWYVTHMMKGTYTGPTQKIKFLIFGTGHPVRLDERFYLDTVVMNNGFVWHVYMIRGERNS